jgi:hypothetical protein
MIVILCSAAVFAVIGLTAAYMISSQARQGHGSLNGAEIAAFFVALPLVGTVIGLVVGCVAAYFGRKFGDRN